MELSNIDCHKTAQSQLQHPPISQFVDSALPFQ